MCRKANLDKAKTVKNDEFYTKYSDIEAELIHYKEQLAGKIVYCNCDTPNSNFVKFLNAVKDEWNIKEVWHTSLDEGISFDSEVALDLLAKCDVVITNPPFSICRQRFLPMLMESGKQFLFIETLNLATMSTVFPYIKAEKLWTGYTHPKEFLQPDGTYKKFGNILWYTNMPVDKKFEFDFTKTYKGNEDKYPKYDNYDAINVDKLSDIPCDYDGVMGVPITFLDKYNIAGGACRWLSSERETTVRTLELQERINISESLSGIEILDVANGRGDWVNPTKKYINPVQHNPDGTVVNGSKVNTHAVLINGIYTADNVDYSLKSVYARLLIRVRRMKDGKAEK